MRGDDPGQPPVQQQHFAEVADIHILRLDVEVADSLRMREFDRVADPDENLQQPELAEAVHRLGVALGELAQHRRKRLPVQVFHCEERRARAVDAEIVHRNDVRMFELGGQPRFADEPFEIALRPVAEIRHDRHGDFTAGIPVEDQQHALHSAETDRPQELVPLLRFDRQRREDIDTVAGFRHGGIRADHSGLQVNGLSHQNQGLLFLRPALSSPDAAPAA